MSDVALSVSLLALIAVIGLWLGNWRIRGVGLGIGGVLFGGLLVGHFTHKYQIRITSYNVCYTKLLRGVSSSTCRRR